MQNKIEFKELILNRLTYQAPKDIVQNETLVAQYVSMYNRPTHTFKRYIYNLQLKERLKEGKEVTKAKRNNKVHKVKKVKETPVAEKKRQEQLDGFSERLKQDVMPFYYQGCKTEEDKQAAEKEMADGTRLTTAINNDAINTLTEQLKTTKDLKRIISTFVGSKEPLSQDIINSPFGRLYAKYAETVEAIDRLDPVDMQCFSENDVAEPRNLTSRIEKRREMLERALSFPINLMDKLSEISLKSQRILQGILHNDENLRDLGVLANSSSDYKQLIIQTIESEYESDPI
jgi:hypothetical protein